MESARQSGELGGLLQREMGFARASDGAPHGFRELGVHKSRASARFAAL